MISLTLLEKDLPKAVGPLLLLIVTLATVSFAEQLSYDDIVQRLYDLERLATQPLPGEKCAAWTSTDRAARYNEQTQSYENWSANKDGTGFIRQEGTSIVAAEMKGPGVIWRIWSARAEQGHIKFFIDGKDEPALDIPFSDYFDNTKPPFNYPELVHIKARGKNSFVPIPYAKSCKIILEKDWGKYFQITYSTLPKGTEISSFIGSFNAEAKAVLARTNAILARRGANPMGLHPEERIISKTTTIGPGQKTEFSLSGPRAITELTIMTDSHNRKELRKMFRELTLSISWDDQANPAVWSPLVDFFGSAPGFNSYKSLPLGMTDGTLYSFWYMPFAKSALIQITNDGTKDRTLRFVITSKPLNRDADKLLRFHAKWHRDVFPIRDKNRWPDWHLLKTSGKGRFCGMHLHIWNPKWIKHGFENAKPGDYWWGEGDEKFFVDGEKYPSTFGTGSEDYFGYAWATSEKYDSAFQAQSLNENNNNGHISMSRFQIADNVPFQKSFEAAIEKYYPNQWNGNYTLYDTVLYWYQNADFVDPYKPVSLQDRIGYYTKPEN